jgi:3-hydroxyacyl-[acyl-carrier-protein] dehydratase
MSELARQIERCMSKLTEVDESDVVARFFFPAGFIGFQGHFPERPILPAVCKIQAAVAMLEAWKSRKVRLNEIISARFSAPVGCDEEVDLRCSVAMEDVHRALVKATVAKDGESIAKFKLRVTFEAEEQGRSWR